MAMLTHFIPGLSQHSMYLIFKVDKRLLGFPPKTSVSCISFSPEAIVLGMCYVPEAMVKVGQLFMNSGLKMHNSYQRLKKAMCQIKFIYFMFLI